MPLIADAEQSHDIITIMNHPSHDCLVEISKRWRRSLVCYATIDLYGNMTIHSIDHHNTSLSHLEKYHQELSLADDHCLLLKIGLPYLCHGCSTGGKNEARANMLSMDQRCITPSKLHSL
jgi:hypothetical protein